MGDTVMQLIAVVFGAAIKGKKNELSKKFFVLKQSTHLMPKKRFMYKPGGISDLNAPKITLCK